MGLDVSGLSTWTDENKLALVAKSILKGRTVENINLQTGIKRSAEINLLNSSMQFQAGACGWNVSGSTVLTNRALTVTDVKLNEAICLNTLEDYYTSTMMRPGSYGEDVPFEQIFAEEKADQISAYIDDVFWQGDTALAGGLGLVDGIIKVALADSVVVDVSGSGGFLASTAVAQIDAIVAAIPTAVIDNDDMVLFIGYDKYRVWATALRDANLFAYSGAENQGQEFMQYVPGTNVKVIAVRGLNSQNYAACTPSSNLYLGTDLTSDMEDFKLFYSQDNDEVRMLAKFKIGFQYAFSDHFVLGSF